MLLIRLWNIISEAVVKKEMDKLMLIKTIIETGHYHDVKHDNGQRLIEMCERNNLKIIN